MPNYPGKRPGTRRIVVWSKGKANERTVVGTKTEGDLFESRFRIELEANVHDTRTAPSLQQICTEKYAPFARANLSKSTCRSRLHVLVNLCAFLGQRKLTAFTMADTEAYKASRLSKTVGPATVNGELRAFLTVLKWAKEQGYPVTIPPIRYLRVPTGRVRIWTHAEVKKLMAVARVKHPEILRIIIFLLNTGCRKGEVIAAEWSWMDFRKGIIRIPASKEWSPKSGKARDVPMSDACRAVLQIPESERRSERWVFPNRDGVRFEFFPDAIVKELQTKAGLTGGIHTTRHCFASFFLEKGGSMHELAEILGHSHLRTTAIYSHLLPGHLEKSRNMVNIGPPPTMDPTLSKLPKRRRAG